jgi:hypothetical protein
MPDCPDFRATITPDELRVIDWGPWLVDGGPLAEAFRGRARKGVSIADLTVVRERDDVEDAPVAELIVAFHAGDTPAARAQLAGWAATVGYRRIWLPQDVRELDPAAGGAARTRCTCCRKKWANDEARFWLAVRAAGRFPALCPLCGSDLPQWRVRQETQAKSDPRPTAKNGRTRCT